MKKQLGLNGRMFSRLGNRSPRWSPVLAGEVDTCGQHNGVDAWMTAPPPHPWVPASPPHCWRSDLTICCWIPCSAFHILLLGLAEDSHFTPQRHCVDLHLETTVPGGRLWQAKQSKTAPETLGLYFFCLSGVLMVVGSTNTQIHCAFSLWLP